MQDINRAKICRMQNEVLLSLSDENDNSFWAWWKLSEKRSRMVLPYWHKGKTAQKFLWCRRARQWSLGLIAEVPRKICGAALLNVNFFFQLKFLRAVQVHAGAADDGNTCRYRDTSICFFIASALERLPTAKDAEKQNTTSRRPHTTLLTLKNGSRCFAELC